MDVHRIQIPQFLDTGLHHLLHLVELGDIGERYTSLATFVLDLLDYGLGGGLSRGDIVYADIVAVVSQTECDGTSDTTTGAGHDGGLAGKERVVSE